MNKIYLKLKEIAEGVSEFVLKVFAKFYNMMSPPFRIGVMVATSFLGANILRVASQDLISLEGVNRYFVPVIDFVTNPTYGIFTITINLLQKNAVDQGTALLAEQKDKKTIEMLNQKIVDTKAIKNAGN